MEQYETREHPDQRTSVAYVGSSVATHRKAERMRAFTYRPRPEARM